MDLEFGGRLSLGPVRFLFYDGCPYGYGSNEVHGMVDIYTSDGWQRFLYAFSCSGSGTLVYNVSLDSIFLFYIPTVLGGASA